MNKAASRNTLERANRLVVTTYSLQRMGGALDEVDGNGAINQPATTSSGSPVLEGELDELFKNVG